MQDHTDQRDFTQEFENLGKMRKFYIMKIVSKSHAFKRRGVTIMDEDQQLDIACLVERYRQVHEQFLPLRVAWDFIVSIWR